MPSPGRGLRIGFVEPHLERFGGILRMVEFANRLVARGHQVTFYLPERAEMQCSWMRCDAAVKPITAGFGDSLDIVLFNHEPQWHLLDRFERARRRVFYALHDGALYNKEGSWESVHAAVDRQLANSNWTADQIAAANGHRPTVRLGGVNCEVFQPYPVRALRCRAAASSSGRGRGPTRFFDGRRPGIPVARLSGRTRTACSVERGAGAVGSWFEVSLTRARGACVRYAARHHRQRRLPRVRGRRRDCVDGPGP
jgi:hypothetical protein